MSFSIHHLLLEFQSLRNAIPQRKAPSGTWLDPLHKCVRNSREKWLRLGNPTLCAICSIDAFVVASRSRALDQLRVDRLDHGNHSLDDPTLVARLAREAVALTVCPLSNLKLRVVTDMADHPIGHMLSAGLRATVNSDDPAYFGGYVADNYRAIAEMVGRDGLITLARNSLLGSFLDDDALTKRLGQLNAFVATA